MKKSSKGVDLSVLWVRRLDFRAEGNRLCDEGNKLRSEGYNLKIEGNKIWAEGVVAARGNIRMEWKNWNSKKQDYECHLETGEVFK